MLQVKIHNLICYIIIALRCQPFSLFFAGLFAAYRIVCNAYNAVLELFNAKDEDTTWIIPVLVRVSNDLRIVADMVRADEGLYVCICISMCICTLN